MRSGSVIGGALCGAFLAVATMAASAALGAEAQNVTRVPTVPLGGTLANQTGDHMYGVYVPTRFGGVLTIKTSEGQVDALTGPDGRPRQNGAEVGNGQQGWYTFRT